MGHIQSFLCSNVLFLHLHPLLTYCLRPLSCRHHNQSILFSGGEKDKTQNVGQRHALNYLSLHDNKILRQFRGHSGEITDISMSPADDTFLTSSTDRTIRLWNLQQAGSLATMDLPRRGPNGLTIDPQGIPSAAFDRTGLVFGVTAPLDTNVGHVSSILAISSRHFFYSVVSYV